MMVLAVLVFWAGICGADGGSRGRFEAAAVDLNLAARSATVDEPEMALRFNGFRASLENYLDSDEAYVAAPESVAKVVMEGVQTVTSELPTPAIVRTMLLSSVDDTVTTVLRLKKNHYLSIRDIVRESSAISIGMGLVAGMFATGVTFVNFATYFAHDKPILLSVSAAAGLVTGSLMLFFARMLDKSAWNELPKARLKYRHARALAEDVNTRCNQFLSKR